MARLLVLDRDLGAWHRCQEGLSRAGHTLTTATKASEAIRLLRKWSYDVVFAERRAGDTCLDLTRWVQGTVPEIPVVVVIDKASVEIAVEALRAGARDLVQRPVTDTEVIAALRNLRQREPALESQTAGGGFAHHAVARLIPVIMTVLSAPIDPKTMQSWSRLSATSLGTLRNWCRTARLPSRRVLLFARMLRAVIRARETGTPPEDLLDVVDRRTLTGLLRLACPASSSRPALPGTVQEFLTNQRVLDQPELVRMILQALARSQALDVPGRLDSEQLGVHAALLD